MNESGEQAARLASEEEYESNQWFAFPLSDQAAKTLSMSPAAKAFM